MKRIKLLTSFCFAILIMSCNKNSNELKIEVFETSESGNKLTRITEFKTADSIVNITLNPQKTLQTISGFGGAFTESSAYLLNQLSKKKQRHYS